MYKSDFWADYAKAMELSIEGNRLIAHELAGAVRGLWRRMVRSLDGLLPGPARHQHRPPV